MKFGQSHSDNCIAQSRLLQQLTTLGSDQRLLAKTQTCSYFMVLQFPLVQCCAFGAHKSNPELQASYFPRVILPFASHFSSPGVAAQRAYTRPAAQTEGSHFMFKFLITLAVNNSKRVAGWAIWLRFKAVIAREQTHTHRKEAWALQSKKYQQKRVLESVLTASSQVWSYRRCPSDMVFFLDSRLWYSTVANEITVYRIRKNV